MASIPLYYRLFFTYFDPLVGLWSFYLGLFNPTLLFHSQVPDAIPLDPHAAPFVMQIGGYLGGLALLTAVLLRYTADVAVWRIVEASILVVDCSLLCSAYASLNYQGRLTSFEMWRPADWGTIGVTGLALVTRASFIAGVGIEKEKGSKQV